MATFALTVIGGIAGSAIPGVGTALGASIGATIGGLIDAPKPQRGEAGKLADRRFGGSSYGVGIPKVWGTARVGLNVFWVAKDGDGNHLIEHVETQGGGGKGGGGQSYDDFWYSVSLAAIAGEGRRWFPDGSYVDRPLSLETLWVNDEVAWKQGSSSSILKPDADFFWDGGSEAAGVDPDPEMVARYGMDADDVPGGAGLAKITMPDLSCRRYGNQPPSLSAEVSTGAANLAQIVSDQLRSVRVPLDRIDVTAAVGTAVTGFVQGEESDPASVLPPLLEWFGFDLVKVDGKLKLSKRGGAVVATIPASDLGAGVDGAKVRIKRTRVDLTSLPGQVKLSYYDKDNAHQAGEASDVRTSDLRPQNTRSVSLALSLAPGEAKAGVGRLLDAAWLEVDRYDLSLMPRWKWLAPGDSILVPDGSRLVRVRILKMGFSASGEVAVQGVGESIEAYDQTTTGGDGGSSTPPPAPEVVASEFVAWSGKEIIDAHRSSARFYVAASGGKGWSGGRIRWSPDDGETWIDGGSVSRRSAFGEATTALGGADEVTVDISSPLVGLASASDAEVLAGANHAVIGEEIVGYGIASPLGSGVYDLSSLRRGERDTPTSGHASGDVFVALTSAMATVPVSEDYVGQEILVKVVSPGQDADDVDAVAVTIAPRTPTPEEEAIATMVRPRFLSPQAVLISGATDAADWTEYDLTAQVPATAQALILEAEITMNEPDGSTDVDAYVRARATGSGDSHLVVRCRASGLSDNAATSNRGDYPLFCSPSARSVEINLDFPTGFNGSVTVRAVGYWG